MIHVYVDGESHYVRNEAKCKLTFGRRAKLTKVRWDSETGTNKIVVNEKCSFFWDSSGNYANRLKCRIIYFTAFTGSPDDLHQMNLFIRSHGFEPQIVHEPKGNLQRREDRLSKGIIEKAKGVDISLATRLLEDAMLKNIDECYLYTSDADFVPVIKAVRRMGRYVKVFGFRHFLGNNSELEYVPDEFIDLGQRYDNKSYVYPEEVSFNEI